MVNIQLIHQRTKEVHLRNETRSLGQLQLKSNFNFSVRFAPDGKRCVATVYQSFEDKSEQQAFSASVTLEGAFACRDVLSDEDKKEVHVAAYDALYPYLNTAVNQLFSASGIPGFMVRKMELKQTNVVLGKKSKDPTLPIV